MYIRCRIYSSNLLYAFAPFRRGLRIVRGDFSLKNRRRIHVVAPPYEICVAEEDCAKPVINLRQYFLKTAVMLSKTFFIKILISLDTSADLSYTDTV